MPLTPGTTVGQYQIVALLGAGGMGEVYRARDPKLNRDVALKIVRDIFAHDPERLARFRREAQLLASLNHPNIGSIYGIEESGDTTALVLELIAGPTLAYRLAQGAIPVDEALPIARQIALALEAAHDAGVIHRDQKPANVKLRPDGTVKVLDFGLAKALAPDPAGTAAARVSQSPTITAPAATVQGVILGTAAYMSPEQARGKPVDKRTDVWAFGCVLFEILVGRGPFEGEEVSEVLARVIERDPDLDALPPGTPAAVRRLVRRCLTKTLSGRLRDIGDARIEIEEAVAAGHVDPHDAPAGTGRRSRRREIAAWSATAILGVALAAMVVSSVTREAPAPAVTRTLVVLPAADSLDIAFRAAPLDLSPEGRRLVYGAERDGRTQLYVRDLSGLDAAPLPGTAGAAQPFFSPDGEWVAFFARGTLQRVALRGGAPLQVCQVDSAVFGGAWGTDDTIVFATRTGLHVVPATGGAARRLAGTDDARWPERLPDSPTVKANLFSLGTSPV
jgi:hypothetical protein